jgi:hypothetical protein
VEDCPPRGALIVALKSLEDDVAITVNGRTNSNNVTRSVVGLVFSFSLTMLNISSKKGIMRIIFVVVVSVVADSIRMMMMMLMM